MGPDDFLAMMDGYQLKRERQEDELYLLRHLTFVIHNAYSEDAAKLEQPSELMPLKIDDQIKEAYEQRLEERKKKSDELFARARERGELNEDNNPTEDQ